jgi:hypothetical protein
MSGEFDVVDALAGLAEDLKADGNLVDRFHDAVKKIRHERDAARAEVEMLRGVGCGEDGDGPCGACRKCSYRRGAEAMREAVIDLVVREVETWMKLGLSDDIRHLQIPEDKP